MKNTKRYIAVVTSVIMAVSMFTGCGEAQSDTAVTNEQKNVGPTNSPRKNSNKKNDEMTMGDTAEADDNNFDKYVSINDSKLSTFCQVIKK